MLALAPSLSPAPWPLAARFGWPGCLVLVSRRLLASLVGSPVPFTALHGSGLSALVVASVPLAGLVAYCYLFSFAGACSFLCTASSSWRSWRSSFLLLTVAAWRCGSSFEPVALPLKASTAGAFGPAMYIRPMVRLQLGVPDAGGLSCRCCALCISVTRASVLLAIRRGWLVTPSRS